MSDQPQPIDNRHAYSFWFENRNTWRTFDDGPIVVIAAVRPPESKWTLPYVGRPGQIIGIARHCNPTTGRWVVLVRFHPADPVPFLYSTFESDELEPGVDLGALRNKAFAEDV